MSYQYGIEVVFSRPRFVEVLEKFNKHKLKHIMSLQVTTADPAVCISPGSLPIETMIHQRVLAFFANICRLSKSSVEKQLAVRQLTVKTLDSHSWFVAVRKLCIVYGLSDCANPQDNPETRASWKKTVQGAICSFWAERIQPVTQLYPSLKWLVFNTTKML